MNYLFPKHVTDFDTVIQNSIQAFKFDTTILETPLAAVFYTDGGYRAAMHYRQAPPQVGGYGVFGYVYTEEPTKIGHGCQGVIPSTYGLVKNPGIDVELIDRVKYPNKPVSVLAYIQMMDAAFDFSSNNITEVLATMNAFDVALKLNLGRICIKTDSRYVLQGLVWCKKWTENGWLKDNGEPVSNRELWETIYGLYLNLIERNVIVDLMWVQGHSDSVGNCYADALATKSMISLVNGTYPGMIEFHDPKGFWSPKIDINPLLLEKHIVFDSFTVSRRCETPEGIYKLYSLGSLGDNQEEYTKITSDKMLAVVALTSPEPVLDVLSAVAVNSMENNSDFFNEHAMYVGRLDIIQKPNAYNEIAEKGEVFLRKDMFSNEFSLHNKTLILEEINPVRLGEHTIHQEFNNLSDMLVSYLKNEQSFGMAFHMSEITDQIFEVIENKKKDIYKVKSDIDKTVTVNADVRLAHELRNVKTLLLTGHDLPKVRVLNKIASPNTQVFLVSWPTSNKAYRHATLVKSEFGIGIWSGVYSNQKKTA
jgi:ribonuclease HI